ncbi:ABC transporter substrate-binding protein [Mesoplasma lactucae]|uniref:Solute-binding protein family 5 domain-containing protein n=1 Tax=Mesoplasma lactucae ATCC 49193 TaxID=81460 RepID=A0A291IR94_9MOLU|nr:ABC transporter substrate-binding protein [Mesoplasma lactucae]ATG97246.1 hypothetical protein CP520_00520 [Mesoplasma lactucae ATCC 49193]ATZ20308.1 oligopeptide ABC transporter substrate-binding protein [Mesoplasma lactucae ATCC 49193]MCL8216479.1 hypothetical protein [Mesoplasma lactucae ATCC 49193]
MLKKLTSIFLGTAIVVSTTTGVVACGPITNQKLMNRQVNPNIFKTVYSAPPQTWNMPSTMQGNDIILLANLNDTLLQNDAKGNLVSNLVYGQENKEHGWTVNDDNTEFTFEFRQGASFFNPDGSVHRQIVAKDILNTAMFSLNPMNMSQLRSTWTSIIKNAVQVNQIYTDLNKAHPEKSAFEVSQDPQAVALLKEAIKFDDTDPNTTKFTLVLSKPAPYFPSFLTSAGFSPLPEQALLQGYHYGDTWKNVYTTGPYKVKEYQTSYILKLEKNQNYIDKDNVYINELWFQFNSSPDVSRPRFLFETGDDSEVVLQPSDNYGWKKYVGSDFEHPKFEGITQIPNPSLGTRYLSFSYFNTSKDKDDKYYKSKNDEYYTIANQANVALSLDSVRTLIQYSLDRSKFVKYFSGPFDTNKNRSSFLRNTFSPPDYPNVYPGEGGKEEVSYQKMMEKAYDDMFMKKDGNFLADGQDIYFHNQDLFAPKDAKTGEVKPVITDSKAKEYLNNNDPYKAIMRQVEADLKSFNYDEGVTIPLMTSGVYKTTWNPLIRDMIDIFTNEQKTNYGKSLVRITEQETMNDSEYQSKQLDGAFSMFLTGWSPSFIDPLAFLKAYTIKGDMENYFGLSRIITSSNFDNKNNLTPDSIKVSNEYKKQFKYGNTNQWQNITDKFLNYTNQVFDADKLNKLSEKETRYESFAKAEATAIYDYKLLMPFYIPNGTTKTLITYVDEPTRTHVGYGNSDQRFVGVQMFSSLKEQEEKKNSIKNKEVVLIKQRKDQLV